MGSRQKKLIIVKRIVYIVFLLCPIALYGQSVTSFDLGFGIGISSHYGDINQEKLFYNYRTAFEGFVRYNLDNRYALRAQIMGTHFEGQDVDFRNPYQQNRSKSFQRSITELGVVGEVNFFPYVNPVEWGSYVGTVYGLLGVSEAISYEKHRDNLFIPSVLMGIGYKNVLRNGWAFELEWAFRKCLNDELDVLVDPMKIGKKSTLFNNDWYHVLAVKLSYNLWRSKGRCRTFDKED